jgi:hypothetical protein
MEPTFVAKICGKSSTDKFFRPETSGYGGVPLLPQ